MIQNDSKIKLKWIKFAKMQILEIILGDSMNRHFSKFAQDESAPVLISSTYIVKN